MPGEQQIQKRIQDKLKAQDAWVVKVITANRNGTPDILACIDGRFLAIEVKTATGKVSVLQQIQIDRIHAAGGLALVARSWEDVEKYLCQHL